MEKNIGPINSIVLARAGESDKIYKKDQTSITANGLCELMISENQFMNFNDRADYLQELSNKLFGVEYYLNDFVSTGIMYYDLLDSYNVKIGENTYNCLMLNDEQDITQGLEENIHTDMPEKSETDYKKADTTDRRINQTYLIVDKQNKKIEGIINQIGDRTDKSTTITADIDGLASKVSTLADLTNDITGIQSVALANCVEGEVVELHIYGNNTVFKYQYLSDDLYLSDNLLLGKDKSIIIITDENGNKTYFDLGIEEVLRQRGDTRDEYILKNGQAQIIRRINQDGTIKDNEETENLGEFHILLPKGNNTLEIKDFSANIYVKWAIQNEYTDIFATRIEVNSNIEQSSQKVTVSVDKKLENYSTTTEMNSAITVKANEITSSVSETYETKSNASQQYSNIKQTTDSISLEVGRKVGDNEVISKINQSSEAVTILANKLGLTANDIINLIAGNSINLSSKNITINSDNFNVDKNGSMTCNNGAFLGGKISLVGGTAEAPNFRISSGNNQARITPTYFDLGNPSSTNKVELSDAQAYIGNPNGSLQIDGGRVTVKNNLYVIGDVHADSYKYDSLAEKKKNIEEYTENVLEKIKKCKIYRFRYKDEINKKKKHIGFIIDDSSFDINDIVSEGGIDSYSAVTVLYKAIQEQQNQIEALKKILEKMKGREDK